MTVLGEDAQRFRNILLWAVEQEARAAESYGDDLLALRELLATAYPRLPETEVARIVRHEGHDQYSLSMEEGLIYLESPAPRKTLPVLNAKWDFNERNPELRLRVGLFHLGRNDDPMATGFRFEMPEKSAGHRYCHAQPITELHLGRAMPWLRPDLPTEGPTFPLDARDFAQLLLTLLVSLYGATVLTAAAQAVPGLVDSCRGLHFVGAVTSST
jgi:hypothetical protein